MEPILSVKKPLDRWMNNYISPGRSGSVGDVNLQVKLKKSTPDMMNRFDIWTSGKDEPRFGSNVQDGQQKGYDNGGMMARVINDNFVGNRDFKNNNGYVIQDLRAPDRLIQPILGPTPQYQWLNRVATVYNAKSTGNKFLPLPGPFAPKVGDVPRGGQLLRSMPFGDSAIATPTDKGNYVVPPLPSRDRS